MGYFILDNKNTADFGVKVSGSGSWVTAAREVETAKIPGKNGSLITYVGGWKNVTVSYPAWIARGFEDKYEAFAEWWNSHTDNYYLLTDVYHPDYYRLARPSNALSPKVGAMNKSGSFTLNFDCKPQKFLRDGMRPKIIQSGESISLFSPTQYDAIPLIVARIRNSVNNEISIVDASGNRIVRLTFAYTSSTYNYNGKNIEYDAETHEATCVFVGETVSANAVVTETLGSDYSGGVILPAGQLLYFQSISGVFEIYPRWFTI